jgi:hypothetical protein
MDSAPATLKPALKLVPPIDGAEADPPRQRQASSE